ncbi:unnamed protein product [Prorocentrum cordatum]|uniref:Uncharacterized protein n=1 Tax=Prorocentrum cordatum TaxID=2364126 RepID=A0ABN9UR73_9DINO|nr:unnamed protein product [Polarella glacialis]|mmetsp:Transcript_90165/g.241809  ORF Transcript_90165/g.241809 Transcript_90165/m.241809 type:complete len:202 (+) Transcript_90165:2-607(+)
MPGSGVSACLWLATSSAAQAWYASAISLGLVISLIVIFEWDGTGEQTGLRVVSLLSVALCIYLPGFVMMVSRLCMPIVWLSELQDVPACCPCTCFPHLDTPWYVLLGLGGCDVLFVVLFASHLWLLGAAYYSMEIATAVCAVVKLCIMLDCCCSECKPKRAGQGPTASGTVGHVPGTVVVGQPVSTASIPAEASKVSKESE